ncbi:MAG: chromate transporter [Defluviitaleaceae bacterium]|nr:chromate transporter [Defluviitaleaceae bacterium]MCL2837289.1 chromate transporter [Defluviitaleaceae bacterium]
MEKIKVLWTLYHTFVKIGGFTVGGGYAMIPIIQRETVDTHKWATEEEMTDIITLAQSMPGILGINAATSIGTKVAGIPGAVACTMGMVSLPIIFVLIVSAVFEQFKDLTAVQYAFAGIRAAVAALILHAVIRLLKPTVKDFFQLIIFVAAFFLVVLSVLPMQYVLLICAFAAIILSIFRRTA